MEYNHKVRFVKTDDIQERLESWLDSGAELVAITPADMEAVKKLEGKYEKITVRRYVVVLRGPCELGGSDV